MKEEKSLPPRNSQSAKREYRHISRRKIHPKIFGEEKKRAVKREGGGEAILGVTIAAPLPREGGVVIGLLVPRQLQEIDRHSAGRL